MFDPSIIFQRTQTGRDEIYQKSHGLTQSERLVLIMIDGVANYQEVRRKLPVLTDERFERALRKLQTKELVLEVFMPLEGQAAEELEQVVVDRFLQQDPLDPVTIIMRDPEEELADLYYSQAAPVRKDAVPESATSKPAASPPAPKADDIPTANPTPPLEPEAAMDEVHIELAESLAQEVRARQLHRPPPQERSTPAVSNRREHVEHRPKSEVRRTIVPHVHWGYWLIGLGCAFIGGFLMAQLFR